MMSARKLTAQPSGPVWNGFIVEMPVGTTAPHQSPAKQAIPKVLRVPETLESQERWCEAQVARAKVQATGYIGDETLRCRLALTI